MTAGPPEIQSETRAASAPCRCDRPARGTRLNTSRTISNARVRRGWTAMLLLALALLLFGARPAHAGIGCDATYGGTINGFVNPTPPTLLQIDGDCTIENFPASNPYGGSISWLSVSNTLLIFNNVDFVGNMSCDSQAHNDFVLVRQRFDHPPAYSQVLEPLRSGRQDRQADSGGTDHGRDRSAVHVHAHLPGAVRPAVG